MSETMGVGAPGPRTGRQVPSRGNTSSSARFQEVCQRLGTMLLLAAAWCGRAEAELFDLVRLSSLAIANYTPGQVSLLDPLAFEEKPHERRRLANDLAASSARQPPVYLSAPKQISSTKEIHQHHRQQPELHHQRQAIAHTKPKEVDLNVAADHYAKKSSKRGHQKARKPAKKARKVKKQTKKKKKKKRRRIAKKKVAGEKHKKVKVVLVPYKYEKPSHSHRHHQHQPQVAGGKFYEYREVPKKGAWKFGYKRGNAKHLIERKEDGHKSHFKSVVKWIADKGKGHHLFDYNHGDHHGKKGKQRR